MRALVLCALLGSTAWAEPRNVVSASVNGGLGAGVLLVPPLPTVSPFGGVGARYQRRVLDRGIVGARAEVALGGTDHGAPIGGYEATVFVGGRWLARRYWRAQSVVRGGIASYLMLPIGLVGVDHELAFIPVARRHLGWELGSDLRTDLAGGLPAISGGGWTEITVRSDRSFGGLRAGFGYGAGVLRGLGVAAFLTLSTGVRF